MLRRLLILLALLTRAASASPATPTAPTPSETAFFESKVRPVLVEHCHKCHSAQTDKPKAHLRLDTRDALLRGGDSGPAVVPGDPDASLLVKAVRHLDPDLEMPPKGKLPDAAIADLVTWVKLGAPWPTPHASSTRTPPDPSPASPRVDPLSTRTHPQLHWAYRPLTRPATPHVADASWPRDPIDHFILGPLESRALSAAPDADRLTLVRRIYFDLLGLPPTPAQVDAYLADPAPTATANLIDRLLASPHFGERWGRHWLDVARYADSTGGGRSQVLDDAWRYRDYVIAAFNSDKPFNAFAAEQIAGDLLSPSSPEGIVATGFLALGPKNLDAQDKDLLRNDVVDEQLDTIGRAFLGLSVGCARCHDHKFDPIPTAEYYALAGILRSTKTLLPGNVSGFVRRQLPGPDPHAAERAIHEQRVKTTQAHLELARTELKKLAPGVAASTSHAGPRDAKSLPGIVVDDAAAQTTGVWKHSTFHKTHVGAGYLHDDNLDKGRKSIEFPASLPAEGEYEVRLSYTPGDGRATNVPVTLQTASGQQTVRVDQRNAPPIDGLFVSLGTFRFDAGATAVTVSTDGTKGHVTADAVQFLPQSSPEKAVRPPGPQRPSSLSPVPRGEGRGVGPLSKQQSTAGQQNQPLTPTLSPEYRGEGAQPPPAIADVQARVRSVESDLAQLKKSAPPPAPMALAVQEEDPKEIADYRINIRGNNHNLGPVAPRGFLSVATASPAPKIGRSESGRRQLADWLTRADNPLFARVYVNRVWHHLFGVGLVTTPDDFGLTGEPPSHPELLDHLATTFIADNWSTKKLIRRIMLSRTYQLSTKTDAKAVAADPENRLLSRMNRRRLDAESLRDAILSVSGRLDLTVGGPTVQPNASEFEYKFDTVRRSVYIPVFRYTPHELMEAFDFPDPNLVAGRRTSSILATQALFLMNSPFMLDQSREAAKRLLATANLDDAQRIDLAYRQTLGRPPTPNERSTALKFITDPPAPPGGNAGAEAYEGLYQALFSSLDFRYVN